MLFYVMKIKVYIEQIYEKKFDTSNIHSVELNLLDGQVKLILRALELYGYNLEYMLNGNDATDEQKQEKISIANNLDNLSSFGKLLSKDFGNTTDNSKLKVI